MPKHDKPLTDSEARKILPPPSGYVLHWCPRTPGLALRVTAAGARTWVLERRVDGATTRRSLGRADGRGAISADAARKMLVEVSSELQQGVDRAVQRRERARTEKADSLTLAEALRQYVKGKRRGKDGLPLKDRTRADYLRMIELGGTTKTGRPRQDGELLALADRPAASINGRDIRQLHASLEKRGARRASYALQVLRAVLNWHGIKVPDSPLGKDVPGRDRIILPQTRRPPAPIPPERVGRWWAAALRAGRTGIGGSELGGDACRFLLLTGCRPGEVFGSKHVEPLAARDFHGDAGRIVLRDTKNRADHIVLLSSQALDIAKAHAKGKRATAALLPVEDPGKSLAAINAAAGTPGITLHDLRKTFASIAEGLLPMGTVKAMLNHTMGNDVTLHHYVGRSEAQLRAGWQAVADYIVGAARTHLCATGSA